MKEKLTIVKIGGKVLADSTLLSRFLQNFKSIEGKKILVHGGAKQANEWSGRLGIEAKMIDGRRITDDASLEIVTMVYAGIINKSVVAKLQALHCNAIGLSGADGNTIVAHKRELNGIDYGYAGDIDQINCSFLKLLLEQEIVPVFCPITHNCKAQLLNTNADTIASRLAQILIHSYRVRLKFCFEYQGVLKNLNNPKITYSSLSTNEIKTMTNAKLLTAGMIPKLYNASNARKANVEHVYICGIDNLISEKNATQILS